MKYKMLVGTMVLGLAAATPAQASETWVVDPTHSGVGFAVRHMMVSTVNGYFTKFSGKVQVDPKNIASSQVEAEIDVASINTHVQKRDDHLRSADFFDVAKYPKMAFKSTKIQQAGKGKLKITGELTMHGKKQMVTLAASGLSKPMKDPWGKTRVGLQAATTIDRRKFGLTWNKALEAGGVLVDNKVAIHLSLELVKQ